MSRFSNMRISKNGRLLVDEWIYNKETKNGKMIKDTDVTNWALYHLYNECILDDNVVFKDILLLIKNIDKYSLLSPLLTQGLWLKDMIDEGLSVQQNDDFSINNIIISWCAVIQDDFDNNDSSLFHLYTNVYGKSDKEKSETYALDFSPLHKMSDCIITLDHALSIYDEREKSNCRALITSNKDFTLFDILRGLFWEFSFHGGPKERDIKLKKMEDTLKKIDSGEEKTISWNEIEEKLKEKLK